MVDAVIFALQQQPIFFVNVRTIWSWTKQIPSLVNQFHVSFRLLVKTTETSVLSSLRVHYIEDQKLSIQEIMKLTLREKCPNTEFFRYRFFRSVFSRIRTEYGEIRTWKKAVFGHFSCSAIINERIFLSIIKSKRYNYLTRNILKNCPFWYFRKCFYHSLILTNIQRIQNAVLRLRRPGFWQTVNL